MKTEHACGRIGRHPISQIADNAAVQLMKCRSARAVCLAPDGKVTVEPPMAIVEDDLVGVYTNDAGQMWLWKHISEDLKQAANERGLSMRVQYRQRVQRAA